MVLFILFDSSIGYGLFELKQFDDLNATVPKVQKEIASFQSFSKMCHLKAFYPFETASIALTNTMSALEGKATEQLITFLNENLPMKKKSKIKLGISENKMAASINEQLGLQTTTSAVVLELMRGFREHFVQFLKSQDFNEEDLEKARLGLGHAFSRSRISLDVNRQDKPIIQSINLLQLLDKDINTFAMRIKEWYSWHFPEMARVVTDNFTFVRLTHKIGNRDNTEVTAEEIEEIAGDGEIAVKIIESMKATMGQEISDFDINCLKELCEKTLRMYEFRTQMQEYLKDRMSIVSPNLTSLIGESVAAKLIAHSGSLSTLAKYPASTIQILGAEKALFRALKMKTNTPKYGLLYNTSFIGRAIGKNKGKISRYLANKCAMAARLDHFLVNPTNRFGQKLKEQVQRRLVRVENDDDEVEKNEDLMDEIMGELKEEKLYFDTDEAMKKAMKKKNKKKKKVVVEQEEEELMEEEQAPIIKKKKKIAKA